MSKWVGRRLLCHCFVIALSLRVCEATTKQPRSNHEAISVCNERALQTLTHPRKSGIQRPLTHSLLMLTHSPTHSLTHSPTHSNHTSIGTFGHFPDEFLVALTFSLIPVCKINPALREKLAPLVTIPPHILMHLPV